VGIDKICSRLFPGFVSLATGDGGDLGGQSAHRGLRREVGDECRLARYPKLDV